MFTDVPCVVTIPEYVIADPSVDTKLTLFEQLSVNWQPSVNTQSQVCCCARQPGLLTPLSNAME
jgi:hypothetical protein